MNNPIPMTMRVAALVLALSCGFANATEPLFDLIEIDGLYGQLHDSAKGWVELPSNDRTREIARNENCSAIGAPRGNYTVSGGQLWLQSLRRCGDDIALAAVYPESNGPMPATWVSGHLVAQLGAWVCRTPEGFPVFAQTADLDVVAGKISEVRYRKPMCPTKR